MSEKHPEVAAIDPLDRAPLCVLVGPTAAGKSALALELATRLDAEIVSLDSMQVYRGMDIGTAKASAAERAQVPQHAIDLVEASERYDVQRYLGDARAALREIERRGRRALFVGGTGFYLAALLRGLFEGPPSDLGVRAALEERLELEGGAALHEELSRLDPASAARLHANDSRRVLRALEVLQQTGRPLSEWQREWEGQPSARESGARVVGLRLETRLLDERIAQRTRAMLDAGWREEARRIQQGVGFGPTAIQALGYREVLDWDAGRIERDEAQRTIALRTRQFARRQRTWYRKFKIEWLDATEERATLLEAALRSFG